MQSRMVILEGFARKIVHEVWVGDIMNDICMFCVFVFFGVVKKKPGRTTP